jgi:hypothetical protein
MQTVSTVILASALGLFAIGCSNHETFDGPKIDSFSGRVVKAGKPVSFSSGDNFQLKLIHHEKGKSFGIPISADGSFKIGWMPIGKYSAILIQKKAGEKGGPNMYNLPDVFEIVAGKTEYEVELGNDWKP